MRNLKRALSLVLAVVMVIGLMVVGASAVSYNDFSDRGEIVNKDAVSMLTTLGIIEGKPDGSYAPTEGVDRAQMAKMIYSHHRGKGSHTFRWRCVFRLEVASCRL